MLKEKLVDWNIIDENDAVVFDEDGFDFVLGGKKRLTCGKGARGVTCSAILMTLLEFCDRKEIPFSKRQGAVDSVVDNDAWNISKGAGVHGEYVLNLLDAATAEQIDMINKLIAKIMESGHVSTEKNLTTKEISLFIDPSGKSKGFHPSNVGFGYSYLLSILTTMVMVPAGSKIFIENPETHLNPKAQAVLTEEIIRMACEKNFQVFVESHSDHVLHRCQISVLQRKINKEDLSVLFFDFSDDEPNLSTVRKLEVTDSGHIRRPPEGFFDQAEKDLAILIGL